MMESIMRQQMEGGKRYTFSILSLITLYLIPRPSLVERKNEKASSFSCSAAILGRIYNLKMSYISIYANNDDGRKKSKLHFITLK